MSKPAAEVGPPELQRRPGVFDAVVTGLGSMIGAGISAAPASHGPARSTRTRSRR